MSEINPSQSVENKIVIKKNGPYVVHGGIPLVRKEQVVTAEGEPITWKVTQQFETEQPYYLCRCGNSSEKPFCSGSHKRTGFDGNENADIRLSSARQNTLPGSEDIIVKRDGYLCMDAGFCGNRLTGIPRMMASASDTNVRSQIIAMVERCPSGSYTYRMPGDDVDIEPDLPVQIAVVTEMTSEGPIMGPLWVTGNIRIERSDGQPLEARNRVTLCRCGLSSIKPLCDGEHRRMNVKE